jgi:hypothetical protein
VGKRAVIGAGTTVTRDVPAGSLALSRVPQIEKAGYADKVAERYAGPGTAPASARSRRSAAAPAKARGQGGAAPVRQERKAIAREGAAGEAASQPAATR